MESRSQQLQQLAQRQQLPVLIVGAGINGAGLFLDLCLQGIDCLLIDKGDFLSGTSAAPSRMIHGGLRYLEYGDVALVREGVQERNRLLQNAPHLVQPLPTTIPLYSRFGGVWAALKKLLGASTGSQARGLLPVKLGLYLYEVLGGASGLPRHRVRGRAASLSRYPELNPAVCATASYSDGWVRHPEWLGLELIEQGLAANPRSLALNYLSLQGRQGQGFALQDSFDGSVYTLACEVLVNATGPWLDLTNQLVCSQPPPPLLQQVKGSHLVLHHPALLQALRGEMLYFEASDGRMCLVYPLLDCVLLGTTEQPVSDLDSVVCDDSEEAYLLAALASLFPAFEISARDIVFRYSGVRPLALRDSGGGKSSAISRASQLDHFFQDGVELLCMSGGKWTSYRRFAEQAADRVLQLLQRSRQCSTAEQAIGGGQQWPTPADQRQWLQQLSDSTGYSYLQCEIWLQRYGSKARQLAQYCQLQTGDRPLRHASGYRRAEIQYLITHTAVQTLQDLVLRRTLLAIRGQLSRPLLRELAVLLGQQQGWGRRQCQRAVTACISELFQRHGVRLP